MVESPDGSEPPSRSVPATLGHPHGTRRGLSAETLNNHFEPTLSSDVQPSESRARPAPSERDAAPIPDAHLVSRPTRPRIEIFTRLGLAFLVDQYETVVALSD